MTSRDVEAIFQIRKATNRPLPHLRRAVQLVGAARVRELMASTWCDIRP